MNFPEEEFVDWLRERWVIDGFAQFRGHYLEATNQLEHYVTESIMSLLISSSENMQKSQLLKSVILQHRDVTFNSKLEMLEIIGKQLAPSAFTKELLRELNRVRRRRNRIAHAELSEVGMDYEATYGETTINLRWLDVRGWHTQEIDFDTAIEWLNHVHVQINLVMNTWDEF